MKKTKGEKTASILAALLRGMRLTPYDANFIGGTTEGTRIIRALRVDYPILKEAVAGEAYYRYYIDPEWLAEYNRDKKRPLCEKIGDFFDDLFSGGMFEGAKA
jgi:hypothetical protein